MTNELNGKNHLPQPRGPHSVGFVDFANHNVLARIYYPTKEKCVENHQKWPLWAEDEYISGLLVFMKAMTHRYYFLISFTFNLHLFFVLFICCKRTTSLFSCHGITGFQM